MFLAVFLVARAAVAEIAALDDVGVLIKADGAVNGGDADFGVDRRGAAVNAFSHPGDHAHPTIRG